MQAFLAVVAGFVDVPHDPVMLLGLLGLPLLAFTFTGFGVMVAVRTKQIQTLTSVMQMIVLPCSSCPARCTPSPVRWCWLSAWR
jgi:hypothetical protein